MSVDDIKGCVRRLGYYPAEIDADELGKSADSAGKYTDFDMESLPLTIREAVASGADSGKLVLLDFFASWCAPCRKLEKDMTQPGLQESLSRYIVIKIDTDAEPGVAKFFGIRALPTMMVLDQAAVQRFRQVGIIDADDLKRTLDELAEEEAEDDDKNRANEG